MLLLLTMMTMAPDPAKLIEAASAKLRVTCDDAACEPPPRRSPYRIDGDAAPGIDAKGRAIGDTGARCDVVGARVCTRKPRTLFRSGLGD